MNLSTIVKEIRYYFYSYKTNKKLKELNRIENQKKDDILRKEKEEKRRIEKINYLKKITYDEISTIKSIEDFKNISKKIEKYGVRDFNRERITISFIDRCDDCGGSGAYSNFHPGSGYSYSYKCNSCFNPYKRYSRMGTGYLRYQYEFLKDGSIIKLKSTATVKGCLGVFIILFSIPLLSFAVYHIVLYV